MEETKLFVQSARSDGSRGGRAQATRRCASVWIVAAMSFIAASVTFATVGSVVWASKQSIQNVITDPIPSSAPTPTPTAVPSAAPTVSLAPTSAPTGAPSAAPSVSHAPTDAPTSAPPPPPTTAAPTRAPTAAPTAASPLNVDGAGSGGLSTGAAGGMIAAFLAVITVLAVLTVRRARARGQCMNLPFGSRGKHQPVPNSEDSISSDDPPEDGTESGGGGGGSTEACDTDPDHGVSDTSDILDPSQEQAVSASGLAKVPPLNLQAVRTAYSANPTPRPETHAEEATLPPPPPSEAPPPLPPLPEMTPIDTHSTEFRRRRESVTQGGDDDVDEKCVSTARVTRGEISVLDDT